MAPSPPPRDDLSRARLRLGALAVTLSCAGLALVGALALNAKALGDALADLELLAAPILVLAGGALVVAMVPAALVAGAAGYAIGTVAGVPVALAAAVGGAVVCALIARRVGTASARHAFGRRIARSVTFVDARPLRTVALARLLPGLPFNATSYALGMTRIGSRDLALGTAIGFGPRCFAYVALGGSLRDLGSPEARAALVASAVLLVLVVLAPSLVIRPADPTPEDQLHG